MIRYIISTAILVAVSHSIKEYRSDYGYSSQTDSFYKLHTDPVYHRDAVATCEAEGAKLLMSSPKDIAQAHGMLKNFPDIGEGIWAGDDGLAHMSGEVAEEDGGYEEFPDHTAEFNRLEDSNICEVITRGGEVQKLGCHITFPFICKVIAKDARYDPQCKVFATGYQYLENVGSCYKISSAAISWNQAYDECQAEGSHLVILNSELEHQAVHNLTHHAPRASDKAHSPWYWYAGVRAERTRDGTPVVYKTIFGQTLKEAGYDEWSVGEPNNLDGNELCGSIFTNDGKYNDLDCSHLFAFICEKNMKVNTVINNNK